MKISKLTAAVTAAAMGITMIASCPVTASAALSETNAKFMRAMGAGWNLGNSLDANTGDWNTVHSANSETSWGNPKTTKAMIKKVHDAGFESIRIPVSWANHMSSDYTIDSAWFARVKEVVDYAYNEGMYVILNTHHDNLHSWENGIGYYPDSDHKQASLKYVESAWTQIADEFKSYGERLIFETLNEPRLRDTGNEWYFDPANPDNAAKDSMQVVNALNKKAVETIRSRGGNNSTRYIMVPAYAASHFNALGNYFEIPEDTVKSNKNRIIVSVHAYRPYELCTEGSKKSFDNAGKQELDKMFADFNSKFLSKGIPVIIGETSASDFNNTNARKQWASYYFNLSKTYGIPCFLWDNNEVGGNNGEQHGYLDRSSLTWRFPEITNTITDIMKVEEQPGQENKLYGDVNNDGKIDLNDLGFLQQYLADWDVRINMELADVDRSGAVNFNDYGRLQQYLCGWDVKLGVSQNGDSVELPVITV